jgi:hypothetical protein
MWNDEILTNDNARARSSCNSQEKCSPLTGKPEPQRQHLFDAKLCVPQNRVKSNCNKMTSTRLCLLLNKNKRLALEAEIR